MKRTKHTSILARLLCAVLAALCVQGAAAEAIDLGTAGNYGAFILGDVTDLSTVGGRLAVGRDLDSAWLDIGLGLRANVGGEVALVVGRDIKRFADGGIWLNTYGTFARSAAQLKANLDLRKQASRIDFEAETAWLTMLAAQLQQKSATGSVMMTGSTVLLQGSQADVEVFQLSAAQVAGGRVLALGNLKPGAYLILNVGSDTQRTVRLLWNQLALKDYQARVLFNFPDAESVQFDLASVWGSMLAPYACLKSTGGVVQGTVIAASWTGNTEIKYMPFTPKP